MLTGNEGNLGAQWRWVAVSGVLMWKNNLQQPVFFFLLFCFFQQDKLKNSHAVYPQRRSHKHACWGKKSETNKYFVFHAGLSLNSS